ncbi:MAG: protein translocase subunit SecF [Eubacteriales bacterium]
MFNFNFYEKRNIFFIVSGILILACIIMIFVNGVSLDIQFKGGAVLKYEYSGEIDENAIAETAQEVLDVTLSVTKTNDPINDIQQVVLNISGNIALDSSTQYELSEALTQAFPDNSLKLSEAFSVNPSIGAEFLRKGLTAIILACIITVIYVSMRFKIIHGLSAAIMALVALLHDVIMVFLAYVAFKIPLDNGFIAVILTILGYSINDTIVIYDRLRENQRILGSKTTFANLINVSSNQTLTRTINTSLTTVASMLCVLIVALVYNLTSIVNFALPMMVGLISGCYSSLFIACPLWVVWNEHKLNVRKKIFNENKNTKNTTKNQKKKKK